MHSEPTMSQTVLYICSSLPSLTETFIYREIFALERRGVVVETVSMNTPRLENVSAEARSLLETTTFLDQVSQGRKFWAGVCTFLSNPLRFARCLLHWVRAHPMKFPRDYLRLGYHLTEACYLYMRFRGREMRHIHCHFVNSPTSLGLFLSELSGTPFSFTMHASNIWLDPIALGNKLESCKFCVSISEYNKHFILQQYGSQLESKIKVIRCGLDVRQLPVRQPNSSSTRSPLILAVAQLSRRKGLHVLIEACAILRRDGVDFRCQIVGEGQERSALEDLISGLDLEGVVELLGAKPQEVLPRYLAEADIFALPCVIVEDGGRDGIPVALMEAMLWKIPVITTNILGLPELVDDGIDGVLVPPNDPQALATQMARLLGSDALRTVLGEKGREKIVREFNLDLSARQLQSEFNA